MLTCIGNGGHARALELSKGTVYIEATPEDIRNGKVEVTGDVIIGVGFPSMKAGAARRELVEALKHAGGCSFPSYFVGRGLLPNGHGAQRFAGAHIGPGIHIGDFAIINTGCIVEHDVVVGDFAHIAPGAIVLGGARIGHGCLVGAGAVVLPGVVVPDGTLVKAGEVRKQ